MKKVLFGCGLILVIIVGLLGVAVMGTYNRLVTLDEAVKSSWAQVENVYQRRADLIPNLVEVVKGARKRFQAAQDGLSSALSRLMVVVEKYPELKATEAFRDLQAQLEGTENRITVERRRFNEVAQAFNTGRRRFPTILVANLLGFAERTYFQATAGADKPPQVKF